MSRTAWLSAGIGAMWLAGLAPESGAMAQTAVPDFSGYWQRGGASPSDYESPSSGPGPVTDPQDHSSPDVPYIGDDTNPILKPNAAEQVRKRGDFLRAGGEDLPAHSLCWPSGTPEVLNLREPVQFLQTAAQITILYQRDHQIRRVYLDVPHSAHPKPSWYGESVGHYENGDTLVIDTIGQNDKTKVDKFGTPHGEKMHIVERYKLSDDRKTMTAEITVDDPDYFTVQWGARAPYRRIAGPIEEIICAENNKNAATGQDYPIPVAAKADF